MSPASKTAFVDTLKARLAAFQRSRVGLFVKKVLDDQAPNLAALLAWGTLSAILPLLLGVLSLAGLVLRDPNTLDKIYSTLYGVLPADAAQPVSTVLESARQGSAAPAGVVAILLLLITGSTFFSNMASVFDLAYHVQGRNPVLERLVGLLMLIVTTVLLIVSTLAAGVSSVVTNIPGVLPIGPLLGQVIGWSISIVSVFVLFLLLFRVLPNASQSFRDIVPGTILSTILLLVISQVFPIYVKLFPPNHAYAVFGVFLVFTFWLYLVGFVFVLGAELNAFIEQPARSAALAEATAAAERGRASFDQQTGSVSAEATGHAPALGGGGALGTPARSTTEQLQTQGNQRAEPEQARPPRQHTGLAGHLLGFVGLVVAAVLLRGRSVSDDDDRIAA
jgi:membrane protein